MSEALSGKRVLVTGASGFIGAHLVSRLLELGSHVVAAVRPGSSLWRIESLVDRLEILEVDVRELEPVQMAERLSRVDLVYHLAAAGVRPAEHEFAGLITETNVIGTLRLLEAARALGAERFVYTGSCFEYGAGSDLSEDDPPVPLNEYSASKSAGWLMAHAFERRYGLPVVSLRPFTVYGPLEHDQRLVPFAIRTALDGRPIELTGGDQTRDFLFVGDAVEGFLRAGAAVEAPGGTFNLATGSPVSVKEVVSTVVELTGSSSTPVFGARPYRETDVNALSGDPRRAERTLGWRARTSLREGLDHTIGHLRAEAPAAR